MPYEMVFSFLIAGHKLNGIQGEIVSIMKRKSSIIPAASSLALGRWSLITMR